MKKEALNESFNILIRFSFFVGWIENWNKSWQKTIETLAKYNKSVLTGFGMFMFTTIGLEPTDGNLFDLSVVAHLCHLRN